MDQAEAASRRFTATILMFQALRALLDSFAESARTEASISVTEEELLGMTDALNRFNVASEHMEQVIKCFEDGLISMVGSVEVAKALTVPSELIFAQKTLPEVIHDLEELCFQYLAEKLATVLPETNTQH